MLSEKLNTFTRQIFYTFLRFPLAMLIAVFGTIVAIASFDASFSREAILLPIFFTALFGLPLAVSASLFATFNKWKLKLKIYTNLAILALMILFYFYLPDFGTFLPGKYLLQFSMLIACAWLTVFFLSLIPHRKKENVFWQFCYSFFSNLVITILFTGILFGGLALTIVAIEKLLIEIPYSWEIYPRLWVFITGIIATWFFLSKMPGDIKELEQPKDFPKYLQALSNFILIPVVTVYGLILYIYSFRSLIKWDIPRGEVIYLFTIFFAAGICMHFIISPNWFNERKWLTDKFLKYFYVTTIPLLILYFVAISIRLTDYGITEARYYVVLFGTWLLIISLYLLLYKKRQFIIIPISIFILILLSSFGPWGASSVSINDQFKRLKNAFTKNSLLIEGKINKKTKLIFSPAQVAHINSLQNYIIDTDGTKKLQILFKEDITGFEKDCKNSYCVSNKLTNLLSFTYPQDDTSGNSFVVDQTKYFNIKRDKYGYADIKGYDYFFQAREWAYLLHIYKKNYKLWNESFVLQYENKKNRLQFLKGNTIIFDIDIKKIAEDIISQNKSVSITLPTESLDFVYTNEPYGLKIYFDSISGSIIDNVINNVSFEGGIVVKKNSN